MENKKKNTFNPTFEEAFARLENILEKMNTNEITLNESLSLFEEADRLIKKCDSYLSSAQNKIETLIKNRDGSLSLDENKKPVKTTFSYPSSKGLKELDITTT